MFSLSTVSLPFPFGIAWLIHKSTWQVLAGSMPHTPALPKLSSRKHLYASLHRIVFFLKHQWLNASLIQNFFLYREGVTWLFAVLIANGFLPTSLYSPPPPVYDSLLFLQPFSPLDCNLLHPRVYRNFRCSMPLKIRSQFLLCICNMPWILGPSPLHSSHFSLVLFKKPDNQRYLYCNYVRAYSQASSI